MKFKVKLLSGVLLYLISGEAIAQIEKVRGIQGIVVDSTSEKPLSSVTMSLKDDLSKAKNLKITNEDGKFVYQGLNPGEYILEISVVGYESSKLNINLSNEIKSVKKLDTLFLSKKSNTLKEVTIKANKPLTTQEIDRVVYNVQADPESRSSTTLEMMRKVPLLSVDGEENIRLKGITNYRIFINGKPSGMLDRNPGDVLRSMPASGIERLEVITTIPAKYDAEGLSGIINIVTTKKISDGYSGNINLNGRLPVLGPALGSSITMKADKLGISSFGGGSFSSSPSTINAIDRNSVTANFLQQGKNRGNSWNGYFGADVSYEADSLSLISGQFNVNGKNSKGTGRQSSLLNNFNTNAIQSYRLQDEFDTRNGGWDASLNYQKGFKSDKRRLLTFSYRLLHIADTKLNDLRFSEEEPHLSPDYQQTNKQKSFEQSIQIDYVLPLKKVNVEAGIKGTLRNNKSDFRNDTLNDDGLYDLNEIRSNVFNNQQKIMALYNSYQFRASKKWAFKFGMRLEQAILQADFISTATNLKKTYLSFLPSISAQRKLNGNSSLMFSYSRKVKRPNIQHLNPFEDRSNPNFISSGNPDLQPAAAHSFEIGYSLIKKTSLNIRLTYDSYSGLVYPRLSYQANDNITRSVLENTGSVRYITSNVNINTSLTKRWSVNTNLLPVYGWITGVVNNTEIRNQGFMYYLSASTQYRFEKGWRMFAGTNINGSDISLQGISNNPYRGCGFSVSKGYMKDKLTLSAQINNPFSKYRYNTTHTHDPYFSQTTLRQSYLRSVSASLNYRFGELKTGIKKNKKGITTDDNGIVLGEK